MTHWCRVANPDEITVHERFGRAVALRRVRAGMTQDHLASAIGLARTSVANIEQGRQQVLLHHAISISRALRVGLEELVGTSQEGSEDRKVALTADLEEDVGAWARAVLGPSR